MYTVLYRNYMLGLESFVIILEWETEKGPETFWVPTSLCLFDLGV